MKCVLSRGEKKGKRPGVRKRLAKGLTEDQTVRDAMDRQGTA